MLNITHNNGENAGVFTATQDAEHAGVLNYDWRNENTFNISHTEVDPRFSGEGIGNKLVDAAVEYARENDKKIEASCSFAKSVLESDVSVKDVYTSYN